MTELHGFCDERFQPLADAFEHHLDSGLDKGGSLAVVLGDEFVVDLWGGTRDRGLSVPWDEDTLVRVFSTSKVMVMMAAILLVDRGQLDLDAPIASYWPEFAKHGKHTVTTKHVLLHQSGLPGFGRQLTMAELGDWDCSVAMLEDAELWFEPGSMSCYQFNTFGHLIGEVIHRITGSSFDEFFRTEFTEPAGADFHFGLPPSESARVADLWWPPESKIDRSEMAIRAFSEISDAGRLADPAFHSAVFPSTSGITNGRAVARLASIVANRGMLGERRVMSEEIIAEASREHSYMDDEVLGPLRLGLGFGLHVEDYPAPTPTTLHWGGFGGSFATMDPATGLASGFAPNQLRTDGGPTTDPRRIEFWRRLGEISRSLV